MLNIKTLNILKALQNVPPNETALVEEDKKVYIYQDNEWKEYHSEENTFKINLMELNQLAVAQLPNLKKKELKKGKEAILKYVNDTKGSYYMLLSNELKYYTVFDKTKDKKDALMPPIEEEVIACAQTLGSIKSINANDDGVIEVWVFLGEKAYPLYFFDYTEGVILCV